MSEMIEQISQEILHALDNDKLVLPTLPEVALKVREVSSNPDVDIATMVRVIENDPAISARIVKVSNSPLLRASRPIEDLKMAVSRLGINYTSNLATSLAMQQMFQATSDVIDERMRQVWSHSTEVSGIAHALARHYTKLKPDQATLAGIVHQIGVLPILTFAEANRRLLKDTTALDVLIARLHPLLGRRILQAWGFQDDLIAVPEQHLNFGRERDKPDYADVVMIAKLQSYIGSDHPYTQLDWTQISAFDRLGLSAEINVHDIEDVSADMEAAMALLQ